MTATLDPQTRFTARQLAKQAERPRCADCGKPCKHIRCERCVAKRDELAEGQRRYRVANKAKLAEGQRRYRVANKAKLAEGQRRYYVANKAKLAEGQRRYYVANKAKLAEGQRRRQRHGPLTSVPCCRCSDPIPYAGKGRPPKSHVVCPRDA